MHTSRLRQWLPYAWQTAFLLLSTTWLAGPFVNAPLSHRFAPLGQYELPAEPYSWLFRLGDVVAALLLLGATQYILRQSQVQKSRSGRDTAFTLGAVGLLLLLEAIFTTTCHASSHHCTASVSLGFIIHATAAISGGLLVFGLSLYDALKTRASPSVIFAGAQLLYVATYLGGVDAAARYSTLAQIVYQVLVLVWLAWYAGSRLSQNNTDELRLSSVAAQNLRRIFAVWAYLNGVLAILLALVHIRLLGLFEPIYFAGGNGWLAQHGVIVGVVMLYLSRHLARGEHRARQLFLVLLFIEAIKYSAITPDLDLLLVYGATFAVLFALRPFFRRGSVSPDWHLRLQEAALVLSGVALVTAVVAFWISRNQRLYNLTHNTFSHFGHYVGSSSKHLPHHLPRTELFAHTIAVLLGVTLAFLLWSLFRPARVRGLRRSQEERAEARRLLERSATSSEDFFKIWPQDKYYYWSDDRQAFIAYTLVDSFAYALADPVAVSPAKRAALLKDFVHHWHSRGYTTCFLLVPENSLSMYKAVGLSAMQIGSSAIINIEDFVGEVAKDKWWRWQKNRSSKAGYEYHVSRPPHNARLIRQCRRVSNTWLKRPGHRERGFALGTFSTAYLQQCPLHYLTDQNGQVIAFANQVPTLNNLHQATVDMMRYLPDKNNAMPFLLASIINSLIESRQYTHFDLGFVPLAKMDNVLVAITKTIASRQISASGLEQFKGKFRPDWQKNYWVYDGDLADLATIALRVEDALKPR